MVSSYSTYGTVCSVAKLKDLKYVINACNRIFGHTSSCSKQVQSMTQDSDEACGSEAGTYGRSADKEGT